MVDVLKAIVALVGSALPLPDLSDKARFVDWWEPLGGPACDLVAAIRGKVTPAAMPADADVDGVLEDLQVFIISLIERLKRPECDGDDCDCDRIIKAGDAVLATSPAAWDGTWLKKAWEIAKKLMPILLPLILSDKDTK